MEIIRRIISGILENGKATLLLGILTSGLIFCADYLLFGTEVTFTLLYLAPTVFVAWYNGFTWGCVVSFMSVIEWSVIKIYQGGTNPLSPEFGVSVIAKAIVFVFVVYILSRLKTSLAYERQSARIDHLTGAANRKGFLETLSREIHRSERSGQPLVLAYIDIDNFKSVNDTFGHHAGDRALIEVAKAIKSVIRNTDTLGRIGGDEFVILFPDSDSTSARTIIDKIRDLIMVRAKRRKWPISLSIGIGVFTGGDLNIRHMIARSDRLMYRIKKEGKDGVAIRRFR